MLNNKQPQILSGMKLLRFVSCSCSMSFRVEMVERGGEGGFACCYCWETQADWETLSKCQSLCQRSRALQKVLNHQLKAWPRNARLHFQNSQFIAQNYLHGFPTTRGHKVQFSMGLEWGEPEMFANDANDNHHRSTHQISL